MTFFGRRRCGDPGLHEENQEDPIRTEVARYPLDQFAQALALDADIA